MKSRSKELKKDRGIPEEDRLKLYNPGIANY
jgi:hypothetical protein